MPLAGDIDPAIQRLLLVITVFKIKGDPIHISRFGLLKERESLNVIQNYNAYVIMAFETEELPRQTHQLRSIRKHLHDTEIS